MKIQQLRSLREIINCNLNITLAAKKMHTSQPGVSKQIQNLEEEIGIKLFNRNANSLTSVNSDAVIFIDKAIKIINDIDDLKNLAIRISRPSSIEISTSYNLARFFLSEALTSFIQKNPATQVNIHQTPPNHIPVEFQGSPSNLVITTAEVVTNDDQIVIPCFSIPRAIIFHRDHPLSHQAITSIEKIAPYAIISYGENFLKTPNISNVFARHNLTPEIAMNILSFDLLIDCVEKNMGISIIPIFPMDYKENITVFNASHIFPAVEVKAIISRSEMKNKEILSFVEFFKENGMEKIARFEKIRTGN